MLKKIILLFGISLGLSIQSFANFDQVAVQLLTGQIGIESCKSGAADALQLLDSFEELACAAGEDGHRIIFPHQWLLFTFERTILIKARSLSSVDFASYMSCFTLTLGLARSAFRISGAAENFLAIVYQNLSSRNYSSMSGAAQRFLDLPAAQRNCEATKQAVAELKGFLEPQLRRSPAIQRCSAVDLRRAQYVESLGQANAEYNPGSNQALPIMIGGAVVQAYFAGAALLVGSETVGVGLASASVNVGGGSVAGASRLGYSLAAGAATLAVSTYSAQSDAQSIPQNRTSAQRERVRSAGSQLVPLYRFNSANRPVAIIGACF